MSGGRGVCRFGGGAANHFGGSGRDARAIMRLIRLQIRAKKAEMDPLMRQLGNCDPPPNAEAAIAHCARAANVNASDAIRSSWQLVTSSALASFPPRGSRLELIKSTRSRSSMH